MASYIFLPKILSIPLQQFLLELQIEKFELFNILCLSLLSPNHSSPPVVDIPRI